MDGPDVYLEALGRFRRLFERARDSGLREPAAMTLATTDLRGRPTARVVLLRGFDERGFVFYTHATSRKGRQLEANPRGALCFYWDPLHEQVRIEGRVARVGDEETDAYWAARPRDSRIGAWASPQSDTLADRTTLERRYEEYTRRFGDGEEIPRPERWTGYRVVPDRIEFWRARPSRLHEREVYELEDGRWSTRLLYP